MAFFPAHKAQNLVTFLILVLNFGRLLKLDSPEVTYVLGIPLLFYNRENFLAFL